MAPVRPVNGLGRVEMIEVTETIAETTATVKELIAETGVTVKVKAVIAETGVTVKGTV